MVGKHLLWTHYRFDSSGVEYTDIVGIYILNLETHKGLMTVTYNGYVLPSSDGGHFELIKYRGFDTEASGMLEKILLPLP